MTTLPGACSVTDHPLSEESLSNVQSDLPLLQIWMQAKLRLHQKE